MPLPRLEEIGSMLRGTTWELPMGDDYSVELTLGNRLQMRYSICALTPKERLHRIIVGDDIAGTWKVVGRKPPSGPLSSSVHGPIGGSIRKLTDIIAPPSERSDHAPIYADGEVGPFLLLNFTDFPQSLLNVHAFGFNLKLGNWLNAVRQIVAEDYRKIVSLTEQELIVEGRDNQNEVWHRADPVKR
jgi:hypothetical protein